MASLRTTGRRLAISGLLALAGCGGGDTLTPGNSSTDLTVAGTEPLGAPRTNTLSVRVLGSGFEPGSRAIWALDRDTAFATTKIRTNSTTFVSSAELVANITIEADASLALYDVAVLSVAGKKGLGLERFAATDGIVELGVGRNVVLGLGRAEGINDKGQIVGSGGTASGAFLWDNGAIIELGLPAGMASAHAYDINESSVVVGIALDASNNGYPVRWATPDQPELLSLPNGCCGEARAINDDGAIAGAVWGSVGGHAVMWDASGQLQDIHTIGNGESFAWGISASGEVVGQWNGPTRQQAFRYTAATGMVRLPGLEGGLQGVALGVNGRGQAVGWSGLSPASVLSGTLWEGSNVISLGTGPSSVGTAITEDGRVVGRGNFGGSRQGAFLWTLSEGMRHLGLPAGSDFAQAWDINSSGWVVGESSWPSGAVRATLWLPQ